MSHLIAGQYRKPALYGESGKHCMKTRNTISSLYDWLTLGLGFIIVLSLSLFWHNYAMGSAASEFTPAQFGQFKKHVLTVLIVECAAVFLLWLIMRLLKAPQQLSLTITALALGMVLTVNVFSLNIFHMEKFAGLPTLTKYIFVAIGFFIAYTASSALMSNYKIAGVLAIVSIGLVVFLSPKFDTLSHIEGTDVQPIGQARSDAPNIYFISFDSMIPRSLAKKFLNLDEVAYMDVLDNHNARIFKNGFAAFTPTKPAMNSMLTLDWEKFRRLDRKLRYDFFSGQKNSKVTEILHDRGYRVQTLFASGYFGNQKGAYIDHYYMGETISDSCDLINAGTLLGFCNMAITNVLSPLTGRKPLSLPAELKQQDLVAPMLDRMQITTSQNQPWFTMFHIYMPGHTLKTYRYDNADDLDVYRDYFEDRSKIAAGYLSRLLDFLEKNDPNAVALITGDHGTYTSRGLILKTIEDLEEKAIATKFHTQDRKGINIAVWPGDACAEEFSDLYSHPFTTNLEVGRKIIECAIAEPIEPPMRFPPNYIKLFQPYIYE